MLKNSDKTKVYIFSTVADLDFFSANVFDLWLVESGDPWIPRATCIARCIISNWVYQSGVQGRNLTRNVGVIRENRCRKGLSPRTSHLYVRYQFSLAAFKNFFLLGGVGWFFRSLMMYLVNFFVFILFAF